MSANTIFTRAQRIIDAGRNSTSNRDALMHLDDIQLYEGYAEPGYSSANGYVATGNWNNPSYYHRDSGKCITQDTTVGRVCKLLERAGVDIEWSDEWVSCEDCGKLFRCTADSYCWQMAGVIDDGTCYCNECIDPAEHLASLEGDDHRCNTIESINPEDHGYALIEGEYQNGLHHGMDASPQLIGKALREARITRYLFQLAETSQFYIRFRVYVHEDENLETAQKALAENPTNGPSVADAMERALKDASAKMAELPDGPGVKYAECNPDGTANVRLVSPEEFIRGIDKPTLESENQQHHRPGIAQPGHERKSENMAKTCRECGEHTPYRDDYSSDDRCDNCIERAEIRAVGPAEFVEGRLACLAGVPRIMNPYPEPSSEWVLWDNGWEHQEKHG